MEDIFDEAEKEMTLEHTFFVDFGFSFAKQIKYELSVNPSIKTQKDLARAMNKTESEISRMLTGMHNLTLDSISKLCGVFNKKLIMTDLTAQETYNSKIEIANKQQTNIYVQITINNFILYPMDNSNTEYRQTIELNDLFNSMPIPVLSPQLMLS